MRFRKYMFWLSFTLFTGSLIHAQDSAKTILAGLINNKLYTEFPVYIVNKDYVIYQESDSRKILHPDIASFHIPIVRGINANFFAMDKNGIYFRGTLMPIDTTGLKMLGNDYNSDTKSWRVAWKTSAKVFINMTEIEDADAESFKPVYCGTPYYSDKNSVWYFDHRIPGSDGPSAVNHSCDNFCYDKRMVYRAGEILYYKKEKAIPVNDVLYKTTHYVLTVNDQPVTGIDAASLKALSNRYSMDKNYVYCDSFRCRIDRHAPGLKVWDQFNSLYITDGIKLYGASEYLIEGLDAASFGMLNDGDYLFDKKGIYDRRWDEKLNKVVYDKFPFRYREAPSSKNSSMHGLYILYKNQAYDVVHKELFDSLSPAQVKALQENKLYLSRDIHLALDKQAIMLGFGFYSRDGILYFENTQIKNVDAGSFQPLSYGLGKDKDFVYQLNRYRQFDTLMGIDPATAHAWSYFIVDKNAVYSGKEKLIESRDVELLASFRGYRPGCGLDTNPSSNWYWLKNYQGYWLIESGRALTVFSLGNTLRPGDGIIPADFELP